MAAAGFTPIQLYYSGTATNVPLAGNLSFGELAINITDGKLYFKNSSNVVTKIADVASSSASVSSVAVSGGTTGLTTSGGPITTSGTITLAGTLAATNGGTGVTTLTGIAKGNGASPFTAAVAGTDFAAPTPANSQILTGNGAGGFNNVPVPITGNVLGWTGSAYAWVSAPAATSAANLAGGTSGDLPFQSATSTTGFISDIAVGNALLSGGVGVAPSYGKIGLTTHVSGTLPLASGGTGQTTATAAFNALAPSQAGNADKYLKTDGTNTSWAPVVSQSDVNQTAIAFSLIFGG
jgi:hypothetical protein